MLLALLGTVFLVAHQVRAQDGSLLWRAPVGGFITTSSPAISNDGKTVYVGVETGQGSGRLVALTTDGLPRWDRPFNRAAPIDSSPSIGDDGTIYIGCVDGRVYALNPATGEPKWSVNAGGFVSSSPVIGADGTIYFGAGDGRLHAVRPDGSEIWVFDAGRATGDVIFSSPAIAYDGTIYVGSNDRKLYAVTPQGTARWSFSTGGPIVSSPAIGADGSVYVTSRDQKVYALSPDGSKQWEYFTNDLIDASPVLAADGTVYVSSADLHVYALNPTGSDEQRVKWKSRIGATTGSTAVVRADGIIIVGADDNKLRALDPRDGSVRWTFEAVQGDDDWIESSPVIAADGSIYFGSSDGFLYKLKGSGAPVSTLSSWPGFLRDARHTGRAVPSNRGGHLVNLSTRAQAGGGANLIAGFVVNGGARKVYLVRAVGPTLGAAPFGVAGFMPDPRLELYSGPALLTRNDNWGDIAGEFSSVSTGSGVADTAAAVGAFPLQPDSKDSAMVVHLPDGAYTAHVGSADGRSGVALVEVYDAIAGDPMARLMNLSTRGSVGTGENVLIAGLVVGGSGPMRLLLRGIGPALAQFGVPGVLARPVLTVFQGPTPVASNAGWGGGGLRQDLSSAFGLVSAFLLPEGSADAALLFDAQPGAYTIQISGSNGSVGEAMVEVYVLP